MSNVKVNIDISKFEKRAELAQKWLKNEAMKDTEPYVPAQTKSLANSKVKSLAGKEEGPLVARANKAS